MEGSCRLGAVMTVPFVEACGCCCADKGSSLSKRDTARHLIHLHPLQTRQKACPRMTSN